MTTEALQLIKSRADAARFDTYMQAYAQAAAGFALSHISLAAAYDFCQSREDGGRLFAAIFDVHVNFTLLFCDQASATKARSYAPAETLRAGTSALESSIIFDTRMNLHRHNSAFVLRYRALWDKLMGLLILMFVPEKYEQFISASSRKKAFRKIAVRANKVDATLADSLHSLIEKFDNEFRTPEAHGTGALRKWSFIVTELSADKSLNLLWYWNAINDVVSRLGKALAAPT
ncbi:MAG TPA: hypothetical protein VGN07_16030 [Steroidobacteraceae bacterium]|jgi:hypothetical protein